MGKVDDLRAMRERRYEAMQQQQRDLARTSRTPKKSRPSVVVELPSEPPSDAPAAALCGHQAISGKRCIRDKDHSEKNHRYAK